MGEFVFSLYSSLHLLHHSSTHSLQLLNELFPSWSLVGAELLVTFVLFSESVGSQSKGAVHRNQRDLSTVLL